MRVFCYRIGITKARIPKVSEISNKTTSNKDRINRIMAIIPAIIISKAMAIQTTTIRKIITVAVEIVYKADGHSQVHNQSSEEIFNFYF